MTVFSTGSKKGYLNLSLSIYILFSFLNKTFRLKLSKKHLRLKQCWVAAFLATKYGHVVYNPSLLTINQHLRRNMVSAVLLLKASSRSESVQKKYNKWLGNMYVLLFSGAPFCTKPDSGKGQAGNLKNAQSTNC